MKYYYANIKILCTVFENFMCFICMYIYYYLHIAVIFSEKENNKFLKQIHIIFINWFNDVVNKKLTMFLNLK